MQTAIGTGFGVYVRLVMLTGNSDNPERIRNFHERATEQYFGTNSPIFGTCSEVGCLESVEIKRVFYMIGWVVVRIQYRPPLTPQKSENAQTLEIKRLPKVSCIT